MASDCHKNFRLRGIPNSYQSRSDVRELVGSVISINAGASLTVHSLAASPIDTNSSVATLSFQTLPDCLSNSSKDEWLFDLPSCEDSDDDQSLRRKPLVFDTHFSGFTPLQQSKEDNCHVDLIAISGLGGHAFGSFRERQGPFMWLRDALPLDAPGVRVLIYGYDTRVVQSCSFQNLTDLGKALHIDIKGIRGNNPHRPVIFIGHSLGGLVMKETLILQPQAVVKMKEANDEEDTAMLNSTLAFLFFGVPHQGMAIESLVPLVKDQPNRALLESLNKNSALLQRLDKDFNKAFGARYPHIISFYETEKSPTAVKNEAGQWALCGPHEVLVDVSSATCGSKHQHPIGRNHSGLVKYNSQYDEFYVRVWVALRPIVSRARRVPISGAGEYGMVESVPLSDENIGCLRSLSFPEQEQRYNGIHSAHDTCDWLLEDPSYQSWTKAPRGLFWIKGNPGAGKSVLMKFAYTMMKHRLSGELVLSFFVHGRGVALQKTPLGIFRALLNTMLESFPSFLSQLTKRFEDREMRFGSYQAGRWEWTEQELREFTSRLLAQGTENQPTVIFIDALDECGKEAAAALLAYLKRLMNDVEERSGQVKICFSSRHYPILGLDTLPIICVDERNDRDIRHIIKEKLAEVEPKEKRQQIEKEIILKARGGFQWAVLVAAIAFEESVNGLKTEGIIEKIQNTPGALDELYTGILRGVPETEKRQTIKLFQWILFAERPLSAQELREALATDQRMACTTICELRKHEDWTTSSDEFERRVKYLSRGLVEFQTREIWEQYEPDGEDSDREAQFIHQSVPDYLLKSFLKNSPGSSQSHITAGHFAISRSCLRYLTLREVLDGAGLARGSLSARFPLAPYAVPFLFHHIRKAESEGIPQYDLLPLIQWDQQSEILEKVAALWRVLDPESARTPMGWPFIGATMLHVLVAFGSKSTFDACLQEGDVEIDGRDSDGTAPLHLAIREGHQDMAMALLHRSMKWQLQHGVTTNMRDSQVGVTDSRGSHFVDVNAENIDGDTPLTLALTEKAGDVIFTLIEAGAELKYFGRETELVFHAIRDKNRTLLTMLIEKKINLDGAVFFALKEPSLQQNAGLLEELVSQLLRAEANSTRNEEYDPIDEGWDELEDVGGNLDDCAMTLALRRGQLPIVNILLQHGISADHHVADRDGKCALLLAVEYGYNEIASALLKNAPETVVLPDKGRRTAILAATESGDVETVMLCVTEGDFSGSVEPLEQAFKFATAEHDKSLVRAILQKDRRLMKRIAEYRIRAALNEGLGQVDIEMPRG